MKPMMFVLILLLMGAPAAYEAQQAQDSGRIEGYVLKLGTGDPVTRARVIVTREGQPGASRAVTTEGDGKFVFENVQPGEYRIRATRDGYVPAEFGQRGVSKPGTPVMLGARQDLKDIRIGMSQTGAIAGRVYDRYGEPVGNATVQALKYTYQEGRRVLNPVQTARTNDLGEYRLFWMQPGQYVVSAVPSEGGGMEIGPIALTGMTGGAGGVMRMSTTTAVTVDALRGAMAPEPDSGETYLPVYYPGTTDPTSAAPIDLHAGANYTGVDLAVVDTRSVRVRGRAISGNTNTSTAGASLNLIPRGSVIGGMQSMKNARVAEDGTFEFRGVAPGAYDLVGTAGSVVMSFSTSEGGNRMVFATEVRRVADAAGGALPDPRRGADQPRLGARLPLDVGNADVDNVTLVLQPGAQIPGRIIIDGPTTRESEGALSSMRVQLRQQVSGPMLSAIPATVQADGTFSLADVFPGEYRLGLIPVPRGYYLKSARLGNEEVLNGGIRIDGDPRGQLEIVLGMNPGILDAQVVDENLIAQPGVTVVVVPDSLRRMRSELYRTATTDASGRIHLENVAPGEYRVFAWEDVEPGAWENADFLRPYEGRGRPVRIGESGRESIELRILTPQ